MIRSESHFLAPTLKEVPSDAEVMSHKLMLRAGMIRKLSSGLYNYLPLCLMVMRKVETIIREEMNRRNAQELLMPILQPSELWQSSGRWDVMGPELLRLKNRQDRDFVLGPTHEEVITDLVAKEIHSYKHLPALFYQIQTKVRDEVRPRFGLMRAKEFVMKDGYSFHADTPSLDKTYQDMYEAYAAIFARCGLKAVAVEADSGAMGGSGSAEFMVLAEAGEDAVVFCNACAYGANMEKATFYRNEPKSTAPTEILKTVKTPDMKSVEDVAAFLKVKPSQLIKTLFYKTEQEYVAVLLRGDDVINETQLKNHLKALHVELASAVEVEKQIKTVVGFSGPVNLKNIRIVADTHVQNIRCAVTGANEADTHLINVEHGRDFTVTEWANLAQAQEGFVCPRCCKGHLGIARGIEVGHIFKLGTKYSDAMHARFLNQEGKETTMTMGCYGIGVTRTVAAIIEQHHDEAGIIWPVAVAPYHICVVPVNVKDDQLNAKARAIYEQLKAEGYDVILDDRDERPGFKFKDADLLGIPLRVVVSEKLLPLQQIELKVRRTGAVTILGEAELLASVKNIMNTLREEERRYGK